VSFAFVISVFSVFAEGGVGIKLSPVLIEERVDPGQMISTSVVLTNVGNEGRTFYASKKNIKGTSEGGETIIAQDGEDTGLELSSWIEVASDSFSVGPNKSITIPITIRVPKDASPGGHFGALYFSTEPPRLDGGVSAVGTSYESGVIFNVRVAGDAKEKATITEFSTDKGVYGSADVTFRVRVENGGNVALRPTGPLEIYDWFGKKINTSMINPSARAILPKSEGRFEEKWKGEGLVFGRHKAIVALSYGDSGKQTEFAMIYFWVVPKNIMLWVGGVVAALLFLMFFIIKLSTKNAIKGFKKNIGDSLSPRSSRRGKDMGFRELAFVSAMLFIGVIVLLLILVFFFA